MNKKGFTLVELLAVIVVLGLVITITATKGFGAFDNTKKAITKQNLKAIKEAANVLATQIDNCDDDVDSELWTTKSLNMGNNCSELKTQMSKEKGCIETTVNYLISNDYLSDNDDFKDIKDKEVTICKEPKSGKITIDMSDIENPDDNKGSEEPEEIEKTLAETIKDSANAGGASRTTMGTEVTEFTSISKEDDRVLNTAPDDYGTSYYYRGNVLDNYVTFADKTWRIVRINGDGSVRLVLDDVAKYTSGSTILAEFNSNDDDNAYVGYMYGTPSSTTYDATHQNINDSVLKTAVDKWYEDNLKTNYEEYLADTLFCNDKTLASSSIGSNNTALGYGTNKTFYASTERLVYSTGTTTITTSKPTFKCAENANNTYSRFTVDVATLSNGNKTNGNLKYPIGLLTADEVAYAGAYKDNQTNKSYYLYNSSITSNWWLSSPYGYNGSGAIEWNVYGSVGNIYGTFIVGAADLRPSINLKANVLVSGGDGTKENPYTVKLS